MGFLQWLLLLFYISRIKFITNHCLHTKRSVTSNNLIGSFEQASFLLYIYVLQKLLYHSDTWFIYVLICAQNNLPHFLSQFSGIVLPFKQSVEDCCLHQCLLVCCNTLLSIPCASTFSVTFLSTKVQQQWKTYCSHKTMWILARTVYITTQLWSHMISVH